MRNDSFRSDARAKLARRGGKASEGLEAAERKCRTDERRWVAESPQLFHRPFRIYRQTAIAAEQRSAFVDDPAGCNCAHSDAVRTCGLRSRFPVEFTAGRFLEETMKSHHVEVFPPEEADLIVLTWHAAAFNPEARRGKTRGRQSDGGRTDGRRAP
ncbi:hypothetical protein F2P81_019516 [Scophthalmus maximus]|uniref:Uncharacterized protein n=1 Tax=Scophthalmus maximus TaxID=52904 RepID=A0A6A4S7C4_SCOMX|nr:hypothetical protein F2P81_019516 [Scophthalmus maximus]